jgi:HAD superfamily hydrolase (TIGR01490 family)
MNLALFDLDHTLIPMDSDHGWGQFTVQMGWRDPHTFAQANHRYYEQYKAGTLDIAEYIRFATGAIREQGIEKSIAAHSQYMSDVVQKNIKKEAVELVERHRQAGHRIVIVTATNEFVTRPIAEAFGVQDLIAIELERDASGLPTGEIKGIPSFREGKVARMEQWLASQGTNWEGVGCSYFYSDSINDLPLLEKVTHPVATNPDDRLRAVAQQRSWPILNLFS